MKKLILTIALAAHFNSLKIALAANEVCSREIFSHEQLNNPYSYIKKSLHKYSHTESEQIAEAIIRNAKTNSNNLYQPCLVNTKSCFGQDPNWSYSKELIVDSFDRLLRFNGQMVSKEVSNWPTGKYYAHQTQIGTSCSWGGQFPTQCEKWCLLTVNDDRFHD